MIEIERIKAILWHIFLPNKCASCHKVTEYNKLFCPKCESEFLTPNINERCKVCFSQKKYCSCKKDPKFFEKCISPFVYDTSIRKSLILLKRVEHKKLVDFYAENMIDTVNEYYKNIEFDCVCAVPMHSSKKKLRGYNQAELIANALSKKLDIKTDYKMLKCVKKSPAQHTLPYKMRKDNVKGLYKAKNVDYNYRNVLLVDDISTSGFTFSECAKVLRIEGVEKIYCISAAKR